MKKLRLFDSLKFVRAMFVAVVVATAFILNVAHAATLPAGYTELEYIESTGGQWIDTGYILQSNDVTYYWTAKDLSTGAATTALFGSEQTVAPKYSGILYGKNTSRRLYAGNKTNIDIGYNSDSGFHSWVLSLTNDYNATLYKDGTLISSESFVGDLQKTTSIAVFNNKGSSSDQAAKMALKRFVIKDNNILAVDLVPVRRDSDGVLGMYDLADANPATAFHTNAGTGEFVAGEWQIKIATTRYSEEQFEPVQNRLSAAVNAVEDVVTQTMTQAQAIDTIATTKQTRPDESCPPFKKCLLVEDEDGTPHWYEIYDPINDFLRPILAAAGLSGNQGAPVMTTHTENGSTLYDTFNGFYNGSGAFRKKYIDNTTSAADRPFGPTTLPRCADDATRTTSTVNAGICYNTGGMFRTLTEGADDDAGEWALVWNGNEGGASLGITPGVVYGIAKCTTVGQHTTQMTGDDVDGSNYWWPKKLTGYSGGGTTLASLIEQYPNSNVETVFNTLPNPYGTDDNPEYPRANYRNCWCKMTEIGVGGSGDTFAEQAANGTIMSVSGGWVFVSAGTSAAYCAYNCAHDCAYYVRARAVFRRAVLTVE